VAGAVPSAAFAVGGECEPGMCWAACHAGGYAFGACGSPSTCFCF
jgi:hypothetical protein